MVKTVRDIRKYRKLIYMMLAWFLLSFFDMAGQEISAQTLCGASVSGYCENEVLLVGTKQVPNGVDKFVPVGNKTEEVITQTEKTSHELTMRFIAIVTALFFAIQVIYHATIHRYGCHMIDVWENIIYIHQIDGKKRGVLLYN